MTQVMIDLETLSLRPHAHILTIGAIKFTRDTKMGTLEELKKSGNSFYRRVTDESNRVLGMHYSSETMKWWNTQAERARTEAIGEEEEDGEDNARVPLEVALKEFAEWYGDATHIWAHGDDFDCVIVKEACARAGIECPFKFWTTRDTRTLYDLAGVHLRDYKPKTGGITMVHHSLHDCYHQIRAAEESFARIGTQLLELINQPAT